MSQFLIWVELAPKGLYKTQSLINLNKKEKQSQAKLQLWRQGRREAHFRAHLSSLLLKTSSIKSFFPIPTLSLTHVRIVRTKKFNYLKKKPTILHNPSNNQKHKHQKTSSQYTIENRKEEESKVKRNVKHSPLLHFHKMWIPSGLQVNGDDLFWTRPTYGTWERHSAACWHLPAFYPLYSHQCWAAIDSFFDSCKVVYPGGSLFWSNKCKLARSMFSSWEPTYFGAFAGKNIPFPKCLWYHKYDNVYANKQPQQWEFFPKTLLSTSKGDYHWEWIGTKNRTPMRNWSQKTKI